MNVESLIAAAKDVGLDEVPASGSGSNPEVVAALKVIFDNNRGKFFRSSALAKVIEDQGIKVVKIGNTLHAMMNSKQCSRPRTAVYCAYDPSIKNATKTSDDEASDIQDEE